MLFAFFFSNACVFIVLICVLFRFALFKLVLCMIYILAFDWSCKTSHLHFWSELCHVMLKRRILLCFCQTPLRLENPNSTSVGWSRSWLCFPTGRKRNPHLDFSRGKLPKMLEIVCSVSGYKAFIVHCLVSVWVVSGGTVRIHISRSSCATYPRQYGTNT